MSKNKTNWFISLHFIATAILSGCINTNPHPHEEIFARIEALENTVNSLEDELATVKGEYLTAADLHNYQTRAESVQLLDTPITTTVTNETEFFAALDNADQYRITRNAHFTIQLDDGDYTFSQSIHINHPDGDKISIVGNETSPESVQITFTKNHGIWIAKNRTLGYLGGLTLIGDGSTDTIGLSVQEGSHVSLGPLNINNFDHSCISVQNNGSISPDERTSPDDDWIEVSNCGVGLFIRGSGYASLNGAYIHNNMDATYVGLAGILEADGATATQNSRRGFYVSSNGLLNVPNSTASYTGTSGYIAGSNGYIAADLSSSHNNNENGYAVSANGLIVADGGTASDNNLYGYYADESAYMRANDVSATNNNHGGIYAAGRSYVWAEYAETESNSGAGYTSSSYAYIHAPLSSSTKDSDCYSQSYGGLIQGSSASHDCKAISQGNPDDTYDYVVGL